MKFLLWKHFTLIYNRTNTWTMVSQWNKSKTSPKSFRITSDWILIRIIKGADICPINHKVTLNICQFNGKCIGSDFFFIAVKCWGQTIVMGLLTNFLRTSSSVDRESVARATTVRTRITILRKVKLQCAFYSTVYYNLI